MSTSQASSSDLSSVCTDSAIDLDPEPVGQRAESASTSEAPSTTIALNWDLLRDYSIEPPSKRPRRSWIKDHGTYLRKESSGERVWLCHACK